MILRRDYILGPTRARFYVYLSVFYLSIHIEDPCLLSIPAIWAVAHILIAIASPFTSSEAGIFLRAEDSARDVFCHKFRGNVLEGF